ncbi:hypothetical protein AXG93_2119s1000 [Marchantia polymorpha subsp. ruderalis]|uniref:Uncharacterized protein n=1 Tax=Marchantia polymorpha subsp. ruderalis TaxID=1480154 RepID=A0A176VGM7_MARPO|nr:hypothetical protein AXG93_2119s1000 [Marchantia polymorpha subsp. ruderalis]
MGCLTATERVQFSLLSRANLGRYVRDVEFDTDSDEGPANTPPARPRADDEPRGARAPWKRKWNGEADLSQREVPTAPVRRRANNEPARPKQKARKLILSADSSADTGRAAVTRDSPSSEDDVSAEVLGRSADLPAPKARVPSEEARRSSGHRGRHAATTKMLAMERQSRRRVAKRLESFFSRSRDAIANLEAKFKALAMEDFPVSEVQFRNLFSLRVCVFRFVTAQDEL